jgi:transposase
LCSREKNYTTAFEYFEGVSFACVFDNLKTATDEKHHMDRPNCNQLFMKLAIEMEFHPLSCHPNPGNQKDTIEKFASWVKSNFLSGCGLPDDEGLQAQCRY